MKSLFDKDAKDEILSRIEMLSPASKGQWGKMDVAQMLAHCNEVMLVALGDKKQPTPLYARIVGPIVRPALYNEKPFPRNSPTAPYFKIVDQKEFDKEKQALITLISRFYETGEAGLPRHPHPFFGKMTNEQWGRASYKHMAHHLDQFAAHAEK